MFSSFLIGCVILAIIVVVAQECIAHDTRSSYEDFGVPCTCEDWENCGTGCNCLCGDCRWFRNIGRESEAFMQHRFLTGRDPGDEDDAASRGVMEGV